MIPQSVQEHMMQWSYFFVQYDFELSYSRAITHILIFSVKNAPSNNLCIGDLNLYLSFVLKGE